ncbi:MAG: type II toxin-antitoxin system RelE/ParE family toxin [Terracidiphilus sp.]|nr:type II toxin-antitoxin system RelE/ParE family toxin [Terracidiphilus sp.]
MPIEIVVTDEFVQWWESLDEDEQISVRSVVDLLENLGVTLEFPYSTAIVQSRKLRELRIQHAGRPYRVLYAFDPARNAVLLVGGNKTGNDRWYEEYVPWAERVFADYLRETGQK